MSKLYDTNEKDIVDAILEFLKDSKEDHEKLTQIKDQLKKGKKKNLSKKYSTELQLNLGKFEDSSPQRELGFIPTAMTNMTTKILPKTKKLLNSDISKVSNVKTPHVNLKQKGGHTTSKVKLSFEGITEDNFSAITRQIEQLRPSDIDNLVRNEQPEKKKKTMREHYLRIETSKDNTFTQLQKKLKEPFQLSDLKVKRRKNRSQRHPNNMVTPMKTSKVIGKGSKSPFRQSKEKKSKIQCIQRLKLINRVQLDRPILLAGKMDVLWTKPTETLPEINIVRYKIEVCDYCFIKTYRKRNQKE